MMHGMMGPGMMLGMSAGGLLIVILALLAIAAFVKYLFFR